MWTYDRRTWTQLFSWHVSGASRALVDSSCICRLRKFILYSEASNAVSTEERLQKRTVS